ncbi:MAG: hypothetical protein KAI33_04570, partial [Elusimicrobiales bacterium]|nr:hypothetical protein [Elusimicrobiales bacterium]
WQKNYGFVQDYSKKNNKTLGNWLSPCPMRDHHEEAVAAINKHNAKPIDLLAEDAIHDSEYHKMMIEYGGRVGETFKNIWTEEYLKKEKSTVS